MYSCRGGEFGSLSLSGFYDDPLAAVA